VVKKKEIKSKHYFQHPEEFEEQKDKKQLKQKYGCLLSIVSGFSAANLFLYKSIKLIKCKRVYSIDFN
jgi:hypothetical protein